MGIFRSDEAIFSAKDEAVFASGTIWPKLSQNGTWLGIIPNVTVPGPEVDWGQYYTVGTDREMQVLAERQRKIEGIEAPIILQKGEIFRYVFDGQNSHASGEAGTGAQAHSFRLADDLTVGPNANLTLNAPELRSLTLEVAYPSGSSSSYWGRYYKGAKVESIRLEATSEDELKGTVSFKAASVHDEWNATTITRDTTTKPYLFHTALFTYRGVTVARVTEFDLTIDNNLKSNWYLTTETAGTTSRGVTGGKWVYDLIPGKREYNLRATVVIDSDLNPRIWDSLLNGAEFTANFLFSRTTNSDTLQIFLDGVVFTKAPHGVPEEKADVPVEIEAIARKGYIVVVNGSSSMTL